MPSRTWFAAVADRTADHEPARATPRRCRYAHGGIGCGSGRSPRRGPQLALAHSYLGAPEPARAAGRRAVDEAARCGDEPIIGRAQFVSAVAEWGLGQYRAAMENARHQVLP